MKKKITYAILLFFLFYGMSLAQEVYVPLDTPAPYKKELFLKKFESRYARYIRDEISAYKGKRRAYLKKYLDNYFNKAYKEFSQNELYLRPETQDYLAGLLNRLRHNNPILEGKEVYLDFSRRISPNAYNVGEGTVAVHLELLEYLENEDQLAAVLAHELSHYLLNHLGKSYGKYVRYLTSDEYKKKVKDIYKSRYGRTEKAEEMLEHILYSRLRKSRKHELEADSLGLILYLRAGYPVREFFRVMEILDSVDTEHDSLSKDFLRKWFDTPSQPFDDAWFCTEDFSGYVYHPEKNADSLKTHPEMKLRLEKIKELHQKLNVTPADKPPSDNAFYSWKKRASYEKLVNLYLEEEYGRALYEVLKRLQHRPDDPFYLKMFVLTLERLSEAKKSLTLSRYVRPYNPLKHSESEKMFIYFIYNLEYDQMKNLLNDFRSQLTERHISTKIFEP